MLVDAPGRDELWLNKVNFLEARELQFSRYLSVHLPATANRALGTLRLVYRAHCIRHYSQA